MLQKFRRACAVLMTVMLLTPTLPVWAEEAADAPEIVVDEVLSSAPAAPEMPTEAPNEAPAATEAPTEVPTEAPVVTEAPTEVPTEVPTATEIPTEEPTEAPIATENPTEVPTETPNATEIPTEVPMETPNVTENPTEVPTEAPTEAPTPEQERDVFQPGLANLRSGAKLYDNENLFGEAFRATQGGVVYAERQSENEKAIRIAIYDGDTVRTFWTNTGALTMMTADETLVYDTIPRNEEDDVMLAHGHLLAPIAIRPEEQATEAPTAEPEVTEAPTTEPEVTEAPTAEPEVTEAPTAEPEVTEAPTTEPEVTEAPTTEPEVTDEIISDYTPAPILPEATEALPTEGIQEEPTIPELPDALDQLVIGRALEQPTGLDASYDRAGRMTLTWLPVEGANAYEVYFKPSNGTEYALLDTTTKTSITTSRPEMGTVYYFRVQALYCVDGQTVSKGEQSLSFPYIMLGDVVIADPRGKNESTIRLNWTKVKGATHYDVLMSLHDQNDYKIVRTDLTGDLCDIANISFNETYDFRIIPKRKLNSGVVLTGLPSVNRMVGSPMEKPSFTSYEWTENGLRLNWNAIPGAMGYVIYRRGFHETGYHKLMVSENTETTYVDTTMQPGEVYYYFVYSYRLAQPQGWRCFSLKGEIGMGVWLPQTTGITATSAQENSVRISWPATTGANQYDVCISTTAGSTPKANGRLKNAYGYHNSAVLGKTYYYRVRPVRVFSNGDISVGPWSEEVAFTHQEQVGAYRALLIGNTYEGESNELLGCDNDVKGMRSMLSQMKSTPYSVTTKTNLRAEEILSAISSTFAGANYNDVSLFYYSGHGANSVDTDGTPTNYHAALVGTFQTYVSISRLKTELDKIPGKKVIIIDACHSGQFISRDGEATPISSSAFNQQVVNLFANDEQLVQPLTRSQNVVLAPDGSEVLAEEAPVSLTRDANVSFATSSYYVITACRSDEKSVSTGYDSNGDGKIDRYFGLFTYGLCYGNGWNLARNTAMSSMAADLNKDNQISLYEAYVYAKVMAQSHNPNQTAQIWPENSALVLWAK